MKVHKKHQIFNTVSHKNPRGKAGIAGLTEVLIPTTNGGPAADARSAD